MRRSGASLRIVSVNIPCNSETPALDLPIKSFAGSDRP
jgi:hypothetical protein